MVNRYEVNELNDQSFRFYYAQVGKKNSELLSSSDEITLFNKYFNNNDLVARNKIIESNLRLVVSIAKEYMYFGIPILDLIQEGNIGLMKAINKFDVNKGFKFSTYATHWIRHSIVRSLEEKSSLIRIPNAIYNDLTKIKVAASKHYDSYGVYPDVDMLVELIGLDKKDILIALKYNYNFVFLSYHYTSGDRSKDVEIMKTLVDDFNLEDYVLKSFDYDNVIDMLSILDSKELDILVSRYGLFNKSKESLKALGQKYGICHESVRQIEKKAISRLRKEWK